MRFGLNKFRLNEFRLNEFRLNEFRLNEFRLNEFGQMRFGQMGIKVSQSVICLQSNQVKLSLQLISCLHSHYKL